MYRSFLPFFLASLGFIFVASAINMPLFDWQISEIVTDFPPEVHIGPSPWTTNLGDCLVSGSYTVEDESYLFSQFYVLKTGYSCSPERLNSVARRSGNDEVLERIMLNVNQNVIPWLSEWSKFGFLLFLCGIYIWWFTIRYKRSVFEAVILTIVAVLFFGFLLNVWRAFLTKIGIASCPGLHGTVTFNARLSRVHYETLFVLFVGVLSELGALGIMLRQIINAVRKRDSKLTHNLPG